MKVVTDRQRLVTDAEVLQEILHRYVAIDRRDAIQPALEVNGDSGWISIDGEHGDEFAVSQFQFFISLLNKRSANHINRNA
jgi:hypothetical protein